MINCPGCTQDPLAKRILEGSNLTPEQYCAAATRERDIVVTAGAGSGKTHTLAARYISLLAEGLSPRRVTAITFTEKAAREMRGRVREKITAQISLSQADEERQYWRDLDAQMDAARIGTIHSLCAEILRTHPAEAGIDPRFEVLDEGLSAVLRSQAVADTLGWLVNDPVCARLLDGFSTGALQKLLASLLSCRLEAQAAFSMPINLDDLFCQAFLNGMQQKSLLDALQGLHELKQSGALPGDAGDKLAAMLLEMLELWSKAEEALAGGDWSACAVLLFEARKDKMKLNLGLRGSHAKDLLKDLREVFDRQLKDLAVIPDPAVEQLFKDCLPLLKLAFEHALQLYQGALRQRQALDFDDLEAGAARLLKEPELCQRWQAQMHALLVDEFQDTNVRQREIVKALCGEIAGRLFVVGDARQSIYRFRRADVTVFRTLQEEIQQQGGLVINLELTYRAHVPLLAVTGDFLSVVMGTQEKPEQPYDVPFSALHSKRSEPLSGARPPYLEFVLGGAEDAEQARPVAARALAQRLQELYNDGQIKKWDDVALLFRASSGFPAYEEAFEKAGIPFVTVAGQGFYNRPEIRDVLNLLRALADPWDDLAMAGLLRSPAFGLSDAALYLLRWQNNQPQAYWNALQGSLSALEEADQQYARRAVQILQELQPLVDRLPVAELLKRLVDRVDYRAILASMASEKAAAGRLWRNLDKLLADAHSSALVNVRAFLEYLDTLRDVGAREGEAPAEAEGAVCLMTIHKSKGLEFPLVILADAARKRRNIHDALFLSPESGAVFRFERFEAAPLLYHLANLEENLLSEAEEKRLLYVALTRAKEKLLISGHCTCRDGKWKSEGWLDELARAGNLDLNALMSAPQGEALEICTPGGNPLRTWGLLAENLPEMAAPRPASGSVWPESARAPLYRPLTLPEVEISDLQPFEMPRPWRATGEHLRPPADALGSLVHLAIQCWLFPGNPALRALLESAALEAGLAGKSQRAAALRLAETLLARFQSHALWQEIDQAKERYHEVPYSYVSGGGRLDNGYIDLLYRHEGFWNIVDFKSDSIQNEAERESAIENHLPQMQRYLRAARALLGKPARGRICFLDDRGEIFIHEVLE